MRKTGLLPRRRRHRRGFASVIAMLFLLLFAALALGFYAGTTTSVQVASNEQAVARSQLAADSGIQFLRYHLSNATLTDTTAAAMFDSLFEQLADELDGTANMAGHNPTLTTKADGSPIIYIPGITGTSLSPNYHWISLGPQSGQARMTIEMNGNNLVIRAIGRYTADSPIQRGIQYTFAPQREAWQTIGRGVLTRSPVQISNGARIEGGDVTSITQQNVAPLTMSGGAKIRQNFYYSANTKSPVISNGARVDGTIVGGIEPPPFPEVDTSIFADFVPPATAPAGPKVITASSSIASTATLTNIRIKANANTNFGNSVTLNGVIYIESPNNISFGGGSRIHGIIVTDNNTAAPLSGNSITIHNGVRIDTVQTLNPANFDASENIAALQQLGGALIMAPNYSVTLAGGSRTYDGTMIGSRFDISNGYRGSIAGNLINLGDTSFTMMGGGELTFTDGAATIPGLYSGTRFVLEPESYSEFAP